jgi:arsenate reductase
LAIVVHGIPNCDTVKKARTWLDEQGVAYDFRDYKKVPPTEAELADWAASVGWEALLNKAGTTFRKLPDEDKADIDGPKASRLMVANPSTIKRPVVTGVEKPLVGFKPEQWVAAFGR